MPTRGSLSSEVRIDEAYLGGKREGKRGHGAASKAVIVGLAQRKAEMMTKVTPAVKSRSLMPNVQEYVMPQNNVSTDELHRFGGLARAGYSI